MDGFWGFSRKRVGVENPTALGYNVAMIESRILEVPAGADPGARIPVTTVRGARPGPVLALIAGNHGYEYPPILALQQFRGQIAPAQLSGTIVMVQVANMPSFLGRTVYFSPVDGKNLNRVYPGKQDGTVSERIAWAITKEVIEKADMCWTCTAATGTSGCGPTYIRPLRGVRRWTMPSRDWRWHSESTIF